MKDFLFLCVLLSITSKFKIAGAQGNIVRKYGLVDEPSCHLLKNLCKHVDTSEDLLVLECIQTFQPSNIDNIPDECQHHIWIHTRNIVQDTSVDGLIRRGCQTQKFPDCKPVDGQVGVYLSCIVDKLDSMKLDKYCHEIIERLENVAFSDYRLLGTFIKDCQSEIDKLSCGRLNPDMGNEKASQGETISCLQQNIDELESTCKRRVMRISEQQAENVKLDHKFFLACSGDSTRFCPNDRPGTGAIYKCLLKFKSEPELNPKCREQILRREKLLARDYKVSRGLARSCREDIRDNHCRRGVSDDKTIRLSQILLCLESVFKNGTKISDECRSEINDHRRMLMMDFHLSPEILSGCSEDIPKFCDTIDVSNSAPGEMIHCLMKHARANRKTNRRVTSTCQRAIEQLIKVSDVGEDWRVDPVLRRECKSVVDVACSETEGGNARVMSCLMEHIGTQVMTPGCQANLMLIQYFVARDFKLDPQLYRNCREDAIKYCRAKKFWADVNTDQMDPERGPLILPCLHRIAYSTEKSEELKAECFQEIKRVMRQRAISVDLIPEVEDSCLDDLSNFCFDKTGKGAEMQCLQDNMEKLQQKCREEVTRYTEDEAAHVELNPVIMTNCREAMEKHCSAILMKSKDQGDMMDCLISHKNDADMRQDIKCRAAIEHFQIISLKNYHFTYKFKEACRPYVIRFCSASTTKYDVVACLSEVMRNDTIRGQRHTIPKECRQQVKSQLYQQRENIDFDPKLKNACKNEITEYCQNMQQGGGQVLECLQTYGPQLGEACRHALFSIKKSELDDSSTDYTLMTTCKTMIYRYCQDKEPSKVLECLKVYKDEPLFDPKCHLVVVNRMVEQNMDFRFNSGLQTACGKNIKQYCSHIVATAKQDEELNGKVVNCLKAKFRENKLEKECEEKMIGVLQEQALNYKLNPLLQNFCKAEIEILCKPSSNDIEEHGEVEECLKNAFLNQKIITKECKIEVATMIQEAKADIHVDPLLQRACTVDLLKYCSNVKSGDGRQLKCLQVILQDESKAMEDDCKIKLMKRMEMFRNAETLLAQPPENMGQLVSQVITSPSKKYFLVVFMSIVGFIFIFGLFCGRVTKRSHALKIK